MTLTLNLPSEAPRADANYQVKLRRAADALRDADLITPEQAAELAGPVEAAPPYTPDVPPIVPLKQGSPEWKEALRLFSQSAPNAKPLSIEETSREALYGDDMR